MKHSKGEIIALIDSDNILPTQDWLFRMTEPFQDREIAGTEPLYYTYRKEDGYITRYCAMFEMNDPLCKNAMTGKGNYRFEYIRFLR